MSGAARPRASSRGISGRCGKVTPAHPVRGRLPQAAVGEELHRGRALRAGFSSRSESTGVLMIEAAAAMIAELFPHYGPADGPARDSTS